MARRYDLPLIKDALSQFQYALTAILTVLLLWAVTAFFLAKDQANIWTQGLDNTLTIEVPAINDDGDVIETEQHTEHKEQTLALLHRKGYISSITEIKEEELKQLVAPWLGDGDFEKIVPYPAFIRVTLKSSDKSNVNDLENALEEISETIKLRSHKEWMGQLLSLTNTAMLIASIAIALLFFVIGISIAFAVKARMEMLKGDVEILHLMGAPANYIAKQFQRQTFLTGLRGSFVGFFIGFVSALIVIKFIMPGSVEGLHIAYLDTVRILILAALPITISLLSAIIARMTAFRIMMRLP